MDDPLAAVLRATIQLLDGAEGASFRFDAEPPDTTWTFKRVEHPQAALIPTVDVAIVVESNWDEEDDTRSGDTTFSVRLSLDELATAVLNGADCLLWRLGEAGYAERWSIPHSSQESRFPTQLVEDLRRRLSERGIQSDLEWLASSGWTISVTDGGGTSSVKINRSSDGRTVSGYGLDLESAISYACSWVRTGMPDCG